MNDWIEHLCEVMDPEEAGEWLSTPTIDLDGRTPLEAVQDGHQEQVAELALDL